MGRGCQDRAHHLGLDVQDFVGVYVQRPGGATLLGFVERAVACPREVVSPTDANNLDRFLGKQLDLSVRRGVEKDCLVRDGQAATNSTSNKCWVSLRVRKRRADDHSAGRSTPSTEGLLAIPEWNRLSD